MDNVVVNIGNLALRFEIVDRAFANMVRRRYAAFLDAPEAALRGTFQVEIGGTSGDASSPAPDEELSVFCTDGSWSISRGDFRAEWRPAERRGSVRLARGIYGFDSVLRIVHSLELVQEGAFLLHSASVIRNGRAFLFSGLSGSGKTTMTRLAPANTVLLSDEISYVRPAGDTYIAWGTPFSGELGRPGENVRAPIAGLYLLKHGAANQLQPVPSGQALGLLLRNIVFFAQDADLVRALFEAAWRFISAVPAYHLVFRPDPSVWELFQ